MAESRVAGRTGSVLVCSWRDRWHPDAGGAEVYLGHLVRELAAAGWDVTVGTATYPDAAREEVREGVRYVRRGGTFTVYLWIALLGVLGRLGRPDVVVDVQNGIPFLAALWTRRPVVVLSHHEHRQQWRTIFGPRLGRVGWWFESRVAPRLQRRAQYVTVSRSSQADLVAQGVDQSRIHLVHNGVDRPAVPPPPAADEPRLVVLGRLVPHKRVEIAIDALAALRPSFPSLELDVVGDGEWRSALAAHARRRGVDDAVRFHGHVDELAKATVLGRAWVQLLPSSKEGWGLVVMEAALAGTPTIAFAAAGGVSESVLHGATGLLVADASELVDAARRLLDDHDERRRLGAAARARAADFDWTTTGEHFAAVLRTARHEG